MVRKICEATLFKREYSGIKHRIFSHVYPWEGSMVRKIELHILGRNISEYITEYLTMLYRYDL